MMPIIRDFDFQGQILPAARLTFPELETLSPDKVKAIECLITLKFINDAFVRQHAEEQVKKRIIRKERVMRTGLDLLPQATWGALKAAMRGCDPCGSLITDAMDAFESTNPRYKIGHQKLFMKISFSLLHDYVVRINEVHLPPQADRIEGLLASLVTHQEYSRACLPELWQYSGLGEKSSYDLIHPEGSSKSFLFATQSSVGFDLDGDILYWQGRESLTLKHGEMHLFYRHKNGEEYRYLGLLRSLEIQPREVSGRQAAFLVPSIYVAPAKAAPSLPAFSSRATGRIGQEAYREEMLVLWNHRCAVSGLDLEAMLIASHLKPYAVCSSEEAFDVFNGLLLSPSLDKLVDTGLISFTDEGQILIAASLSAAQRQILQLHPDLFLSRVPGPIRPYLAYHRARVFEKGRR